MRIDRLRIRNFRRFREVDVELPDGVTALIGRNGAGKSTLLEAIGWCLYGHEAARTGKDLLKRRGAAPGDDVLVELAFSYGGHAYEIRRELMGRSEAHVCSLTVDGRLVVPGGPQSHKEATRYVARLFHMDREAFFTSLVARQRELNALTDAPASARKRVLLGLLRLDTVDDAIGLARARKREARSELAGVRTSLKPLPPLRESLEAARKLLESGEAGLRQADARIATLVDGVEEARAQREASRGRAEAHRSAHAALALAQERLAHAQKETARLEADLARVRACASEAGTIAPALDALPEAKRLVERLVALGIRHEELSRVRAALSQAEAETRQAEQAALEATSLATQVAEAPALRERVEDFLVRRARHEELQNVARQMAEAESDVAAARREASEASSALAGLCAARSLSERATRQRAATESRLAALSPLLQDALLAREGAARELARLEERATRIRSMGPASPCPTCTRPLGEHHDALLHGWAQEVEALRVRLAQAEPEAARLLAEEHALRAGLADLAAREAELHAKLASLAREEARHASAQRAAALAEARLDALRAHATTLAAHPFDPEALDAAQKALARAEQAAQRHARLVALSQNGARERAAHLRAQAAALAAEPFDPAQLKAAQGRLAELERTAQRHARLLADADREDECVRLHDQAQEALGAARAQEAQRRGELDAVPFDREAHEALEARTREAEARLQEARVHRERLVGEHLRARDHARHLEEALREQESLAARAKDLESRVALLERLAADRDAGLLPEFKDHLIGRIRPLLSAHAGRLFRDLSEGRYADLEVDGSYDLLVHEDGQSFALERFSGGEGDLANLCLRLAVGQVVAERAGTEGFGFLALDEIFGSQDEIRKGNILRALKGLSTRFRQILLVTHLDDVKDAAETVLRVVADDDGTSRVLVE